VRLSTKQQRRRKLLAWRREQYEKISAAQLAYALSCEALPDDETPFHLRSAVTAFRHLNCAARVAACRSYLRRLA